MAELHGNKDVVTNVEELLKALSQQHSIDPLKKLFWSELNYHRTNESISRSNWPESTAGLLTENPVLLAIGYGDFPIIYSRLASDRLHAGSERLVVTLLMHKYLDGLFIFSDQSQRLWHFVNVKNADKNAKRRLFRRITVGPEERLRTASERIAMLDLPSIHPETRLAVIEQHEKAFDVEAVTRKFFDDYKILFDILQKDLRQQTSDNQWSHDYALQFLNRCMVLYFIQRKGWLGNDKEFLRTFWESYRHSAHEEDSFTFNITDAHFEQVFHFLEGYNFTLVEGNPLDQEVAVDPEMIGRVYESLVNVSELDERGDAGIFYTPRTEIDLMCRLSLVDYLAHYIEEKQKYALYDAIFALEPEEKAAADDALQALGLWDHLYGPLREVTVVDPACGSGAFLVGMLQVLDDLQERADASRHGAGQESSYTRKKRIIGQSLYGVDAMEWAVRITELRLWLALIIDAGDSSLDELHTRCDPLLPHLTCKIRSGDSLVEQMSGTNGGFDIVIGNPPYVRQEQISNPRLPRNEVTAENRQAYKKLLADTVYNDFQEFFQFNPGTGKIGHRIDARSDLYIYFYLRGLRLLNSRGSFCFITPNSWLDVGYGADLQEFLLKHCKMKMILDNQAKRSFVTADVNTIIALFSAPSEKPGEEALNNTARFVMFKVGFEQVLTADTFKSIEKTRERTSTPEYRVYPVQQKTLLAEGYTQQIAGEAENASRKSTRRHPIRDAQTSYSINKWGGKYLRAPDIYWIIQKKGRDKLVRPGDIADIRFGIKTGANTFFHLDASAIKKWNIEDEFLKPAIQSPRECKGYVIDPGNLKLKMFVCQKDRRELAGTSALEYIQWGESQGFNKRPSCAGRARWWDIGRQQPFDFVALRFRDKRNWSPVNRTPSLLAGDIMFVGRWHDRSAIAVNNALANSTLAILVSEIYGRVNLGDGLLTTYGPEIAQFDFVSSSAFSNAEKQELVNQLESMSKREVQSIFDEVYLSDRLALDSVIFDLLGLTQSERDAVYEAVITIVEMRLKKASCLDTRKTLEPKDMSRHICKALLPQQPLA